jgi:signal transduction histidine kinase/Fe-S-cluster-containing hydrogenase component 2
MTAAFITTVTERCRVCYTCVRECPAKAIRIVGGQAEVVAERCIACGNCVRVCAKQAKRPVCSIEQVRQLLRSGSPVAACIAPSFPAEFAELDYRQMVGWVRRLGFAAVHEVAFGADLVAAEYRLLLARQPQAQYISSACPAIVGFVERYYPGLVDRLAPIVSPMIALARYLRQQGPDDLQIVFIGPCIAKKAEAVDGAVQGEIDAVLTFEELRQMIAQSGCDAVDVACSDFDPPHGGPGALYPISRGALQASGLTEDLMTGEIVCTQGRQHVREAIQEFADGDLGARLLEVLCCEGCIMGAGITNELPLFNRRRRVREHVCRRLAAMDHRLWEADLRRAALLPLGRGFANRDQRIPPPDDGQLRSILAKLGKTAVEEELNCGACGYETCREHASAIYRGLAENEMCLPHTIDRLSQAIRELEESHQQLADAQEALVQSEKLASMGQLAAGIAHEVNNPLGIVLMYAHLVLDEASRDDAHFDDIQMIAQQADRCKKIVAGLLNFARQNKVARLSTNIPHLIEQVLGTIRAPSGPRPEIDNQLEDPIAEIDRDQIAQVLTNLVNNAIAATPERGRIVVGCSGDQDWICMSVSDTGTGIPKENLKKIFEPFFTTKEIGKGTGLGLAVSYGIVKMHCGDIQVESNADPALGPTGTTFRVKLPRRDF